MFDCSSCSELTAHCYFSCLPTIESRCRCRGPFKFNAFVPRTTILPLRTISSCHCHDRVPLLYSQFHIVLQPITGPSIFPSLHFSCYSSGCVLCVRSPCPGSSIYIYIHINTSLYVPISCEYGISATLCPTCVFHGCSDCQS